MGEWVTPPPAAVGSICHQLTYDERYEAYILDALGELTEPMSWAQVDVGNETEAEAAANMQTAFDAFLASECPMAQQYDSYLDIPCTDMILQNGNPMAWASNANIENGGNWWIYPPALDNEIRCYRLMRAGNWRLTARHSKNTDRAKVKVYIDGDVILDLDGYHASAQYNLEVTADFAISGPHIVTVANIVYGKTGNGYYQPITSYHFAIVPV